MTIDTSTEAVERLCETLEHRDATDTEAMAGDMIRALAAERDALRDAARAVISTMGCGCCARFNHADNTDKLEQLLKDKP